VGQLRFGTDGVRGQALTELTPEYVASLGRAAAQVLGGEIWLIGRDTRQSGTQLSQALVDGLSAGGMRSSVTGILPTPALAYLSHRIGVPAAMVTASHNPWQDNGVKIFAAGGVKLSDDVEQAIEAAIGPAPKLSATWDAGMSSAVADYSDHLVSMLGAGSLRGMRMVLDCANGAMHHAAPSVALRLGAEVVPINVSPNGQNINEACGATHPGSLSAAVVSHRADLGLAFDGDGDRVIAVDHLGKVVDGDRLIALAALQLRDEGQLTNNAVVVTVMSNLGFHKAMAASGVDVVTTAVGDRYVLEALDAGSYSIGGEQSGHIIYRHLATTGDGLLAGMRVAQYVHRQGRSLAELADAVMTSYPQVLVNVKVASRHPHVAEEMAGEIAAAESSLDGEGRILVRPSGTEPLIRVMVEAATQPLAQTVAQDLAGVVLSRFG
jgi:phosphoglucosamine mutase